MTLDKISEDRLFQNNSKDEVVNWCQNLEYFNYMRSRGGHNCEGDAFCAYFKFLDIEDLCSNLSKIGIILSKLDENSIVFDPSKSYSLYDLDNLKIVIPQFSDFEQPQNLDIFEYRVHVWVLEYSFEISVSGIQQDNAYKVSNKDFEVCQSLEKEFEKLGWKSILDESIKSHSHCVSEVKYPELFINI